MLRGRQQAAQNEPDVGLASPRVRKYGEFRVGQSVIVREAQQQPMGGAADGAAIDLLPAEQIGKVLNDASLAVQDMEDARIERCHRGQAGYSPGRFLENAEIGGAPKHRL